MKEKLQIVEDIYKDPFKIGYMFFEGIDFVVYDINDSFCKTIKVEGNSKSCYFSFSKDKEIGDMRLSCGWMQIDGGFTNGMLIQSFSMKNSRYMGCSFTQLKNNADGTIIVYEHINSKFNIIKTHLFRVGKNGCVLKIEKLSEEIYALDVEKIKTKENKCKVVRRI